MDGELAPAELPASCSFEDFCASYARTQAVLVKGCADVAGHLFGLAELWEMHERWPEMVQQSFSCEHGKLSFRNGRKRKAPDLTPSDVLGPEGSRPQRWYASFIVTREDALQHLLSQLPFATPPFLSCAPAVPASLRPAMKKRKLKRKGAAQLSSRATSLPKAAVSHNESCWLFVGQNDHRRPMNGRPEHTDRMQHHGTWHLQLAGSKVWYLRPTSELLEAVAPRPPAAGATAPRHAVRCDAGDVLVVNTKLWWHSTKLPSLLDEGRRCQHLSISYARDFVISSAATGAAALAREAASIARSSEEDPRDDQGDGGDGDGMCDMNVDGMLATGAIKKGEVIMMADDMPEREQQLCVKASPNCMVRDLANGSSALVAVKDIASGDLFLVLGYEEDADDPTLMKMKTFVV